MQALITFVVSSSCAGKMIGELSWVVLSPSTGVEGTAVSGDGNRPAGPTSLTEGDLRHCRRFRAGRSDRPVTAGVGTSTHWPVIVKDPATLRVPPHLADYEAARAGFSWRQARQALDGLPGGGLNIAHEAVDRHAAGSRRDHEALRFIRADGGTRSWTYAQLAEESARFATVLRDLGVGRGQRVFSLLGRCPELFVACWARSRTAASSVPSSRRSAPSRCASGSASARAGS
jgi:hypothetical protein